MRKLHFFLIGMLLLTLFSPRMAGALAAGNGDKDKYVTREEYENLKHAYDDLHNVVQQLIQQKPSQAQPSVSASTPAETEELTSTLERELKQVNGKVRSLTPGDSNFIVTGSGFSQFTDLRNANSSFGAGFNPIFLFKMNDRLLFESELELALEGGATTTNLEYANLSYLLNDYMTIDAGKFLSPFGSFTERYHPKWINKLLDKPFGYDDDHMLAPESQIGIQVRGGFPLIYGTKANYAVYISNGPTLSTAAASAGNLGFGNTNDNNHRKAYGGRIGFLPIPEAEVGYSLEGSRVGSSGTTFDEVDALLQGVDLSYRHDSEKIKGTINFKAEQLWSLVDRADYGLTDANGNNTGGFRNDRSAHYFQVSYRPSHLKEPIIKDLELIFRFDQIHNPSLAPVNQDELRYTFGLDYWLTSNTVLKFAYEADHRDQTTTDASGLLAGIATGF